MDQTLREVQNEDQTAIVTKIINPNHFYIFNPHLRNENCINEIESKLKEIENEQTPNKSEFSYIPKKNDCVAYYWQEGKKWIRCMIDEIKAFNYVIHYFLFALDYGKLKMSYLLNTA